MPRAQWEFPLAMFPEQTRSATRPRRGSPGALRLLRIALALFALCSAACGKKDERGEEAFAADRNVTVWSSLAQVRQQVATLHYGERVEVLEKRNDQVRVRTALALFGWTEERALMDSALWHRARALADRAAALPVQARASTDKLTNAHIDPGRKSPRVFQFRGATPLEVLEHSVADFTPGAEDAAAAKDRDANAAPAEVRREDWVLVRANSEVGVTIAGWVLRRFIKYEIPPELLDYSNQYRFVGWFVLSRVPSGTGAAGAPPLRGPGPPESRAGELPATGGLEKPQFLVAGIQGPEGQSCDFTMLRVYTWGAQRQRYETAYVESNLCGALPIRVQPAAAPGANATFAFANNGKDRPEEREYTMHQTSVRRTDHRPAPKGRRAARGSGE
jgi:hypothetical protein